MARKLVQYIEITDDFDRESPADETIEVAIDGTVYELDLSSVTAKELREFLHPYQEVAHDQWKMPPRKKKRKSPVSQALTDVPKPAKVKPQGDYPAMMADREARSAIREWAQGSGHTVGRTGKIPVEVLKAFMEANPKAYVPESTLIDAGLK